MPVTRYQFCGLSVRGFTTSLGWNGQSSQMTIQLVQDPQNGDSYVVPPVGTPAYFNFGTFFKFYGIVQKEGRTGSVEGLPLFEIILTDPREILDGTQVIVGGYSGIVQGIYNLFNVYGYWESTGFGNSLVNETGMPWYLIRDALIALANQPNYLPYGGPLTYRGVKYSLDLSQLPTVPNFYRVGGGYNLGLLEIINRLCEDAGCDYFVELDGFTIRIRTVSRRVQPPLGTIAALVSDLTGQTVIRNSIELESRNEITTAFLVGSEVSTLHQTDAISSFWGYDSIGNPILGTPGRIDFLVPGYTAVLANPLLATATTASFNAWSFGAGINWPNPPFYMTLDNEVIRLDALIGGAGGTFTYNITRGQFLTSTAFHNAGVTVYRNLQSVWGENISLNASPISDLIGSFIYDINTIELRLAKVNFESWAAYMVHYRPFLSGILGIASTIRNMGGINGRLAPNLINDGPQNVGDLCANAVANDRHIRTMRVYEFVKSYADEYMGRKYAVALPFVLHKQDPDTLRISASYDISDGGYLPEGSTPLGLSLLNEDVFKNPDGRFRCFVTFSDLTSVDFSYLNPNGLVVENGTLYMEAQVDPNLIYLPNPACVVTLQGPLFEKAADTVGDVTIVGAVMQENAAKAQQILELAQFGGLGLKVHPLARDPDAAAIPLKSNILTYGPWYAVGAPGKVRAEQDPSLNPWNYGGYTSMNQAALARVNDALTNMQVGEAGTLELVGAPTISLGDVLSATGPNVTNIDVSYGTQGITTTYRFQTYTSRFGVFSKLNADRFKTLSKTGQELRRALRASTKEGLAKTAIAARADLARKFIQNAPQAVRMESPHEVFVAYATPAGTGLVSTHPGEFPSAEGDDIVRTAVSTATYKEALVLSNADDSSQYQRTAMMSLNGLLRPFCTKPNTDSDEVMSSFQDPVLESEICVTSLNPWKDKNDIECYAFGASYQGLHAFRHQENGLEPYTHARALALRGPLVISGWGYAWDGSGPIGTGISPFFMQNPQDWKTGPVDLLYDTQRGVWTSHDILKGRTLEAIPAEGSGLVSVYHNENEAGWDLYTFNWSDAEIAQDIPVYMGYNVVDNRWYVV